MRILIISDTHGRTNTIRDVLDTVGDIDMFIHLGMSAEMKNIFMTM